MTKQNHPSGSPPPARPVLSFDWGAIQWLCNGEIDPEAQQTFGLVYIHVGQQNPPHYHPNCEELIYVLSGECDHRLGEATIHLETGSAPASPRTSSTVPSTPAGTRCGWSSSTAQRTARRCSWTAVVVRGQQ